MTVPFSGNGSREDHLPHPTVEDSPRAAPTMPGRSILGSAVDLRRDQLGTQLRAQRDLGDVVRFRIGPRLTVHSIFAPEGVRRVLAGGTGHYRKDNRFYVATRDTFGDGLLTSQDDAWLRQKRFLQPLFTPARVRQYAPAMTVEAADLVERWREPARTGQRVELYGEMSRFTLRAVGRILFGADLEEAVPLVRTTLPVLADHVLRRGFALWPMPASWPTPANRRAGRARHHLEVLIDEMVSARRTSGLGDDLLGRLIAARDGEDSLTDQEVRDQMLIFLLAGSDTTAITLTFALHLLGHHPHIQQSAYEEVRDVLAGRPPSAADLDSLPWLSMVLKEALRLYPPAYATSRRLVGGDDEIGGCRIPDGGDVAVYPWVTHRHPHHWDDPERFEPRRFTPERESARHRYAWFPFGGGPRSCIGGHFAWLESFAVLSAVLAAYRVETPAVRIPVTPRVTLQPAAPVWLSLSPR